MINLFKNEDLNWKRFQGGDDFDYPIDYSAALLNANKDGHVDILYRWEPHCYCHFHRHTAEVSSLILDGELHVIDIDLDSGKEIGSRVRSKGDYAHKEIIGSNIIEANGGRVVLLPFLKGYSTTSIIKSRRKGLTDETSIG